MRKMLKIISLFLVIMLLLQSFSHAAVPGYVFFEDVYDSSKGPSYKPYQNHIASYASNFVDEGNRKGILAYSIDYRNKRRILS